MHQRLTHTYIYIIGVLVALAATGNVAWAQQDPALSHYWLVEPQFIPAAVGRTPQLNINAAMQTHAAGYEDGGSTL